MKFKAYTGITWSVLELTGLIEDEDSRVYYEKFKKHLGLHPFHLTNLDAALNEILSSNLNSYDADLKGFLLSYENPKLLTPLGEIFYDTCFIHVDIEAGFYIFKPEVGCTLKGIVNKKGLDHIGVLVHKAFNVSIPQPDDEENWPGENLVIGQEVRFVITHLDFTSKLPFIRGTFNPGEYLRGCRLVQKNVNNIKHLKKDDNTEYKNENNVKIVSETSPKNIKAHTFFTTDSEDASDEDVPCAKVKTARQEKLKKKEGQKEHLKSSEKKDGVKDCKKRGEGIERKSKLIKAEVLHSQHINDPYRNGEVEGTEELKVSTNSEHQNVKKSKVKNSQTNICEDHNDVKCGEEVKTASKSSSTLGDEVNKKCLVYPTVDSDLEHINEDIVEKKPKIKKHSLKRKQLDNTDVSAAEISSDLCIEYTNESSKRSKKNKVLHIKSEEVAINVKSEDFETCSIKESSIAIEDVPRKKHKKHKHSPNIPEEVPETVQVRTTDQTPEAKDVKKFNTLNSKLQFPHIKIKKERKSSGSENTQEEDHGETNDLNSDHNIKEENVFNNFKKKRNRNLKTSLINTDTIKVEPTCVNIKVEKPDYVSDDNIIEDIDTMKDIKDVLKVKSPKKGHYIEMKNRNDSDEADTKSDMKGSKKKQYSNTHNADVKPGKLIVTDESDIGSGEAIIHQIGERKKKANNTSLHRQKNKTCNSESFIMPAVDFSNVKIKTERFADS